MRLNGSDKWKPSREAVQNMDDHMINQINATVGEDDILYHLGDFAFGIYNRYANICENYRRRINCKNVHMIWGNHDQPNEIRHLFTRTYDLCEIEIKYTKVVLCHYAMCVWNKMHKNSIHLYAHSHSNAEAALERMMPGRRSMDVGVDNAKKILGDYRPFSLEEILKIMSKKTGHLIDHHGER